jgi:hypothetical protein
MDDRRNDRQARSGWGVTGRPFVAPRPIYRLSRLIPGRMRPIFTLSPPISWTTDPPSRARPIPIQMRSVFTPPPPISSAVDPLSRPGRFPTKCDRFLPRRRRFLPSRTCCTSALNQTKWGMPRPLFCRVGETEYHISE